MADDNFDTSDHTDLHSKHNDEYEHALDRIEQEETYFKDHFENQDVLQGRFIPGPVGDLQRQMVEQNIVEEEEREKYIENVFSQRAAPDKKKASTKTNAPDHSFFESDGWKKMQLFLQQVRERHLQKMAASSSQDSTVSTGSQPALQEYNLASIREDKKFMKKIPNLGLVVKTVYHFETDAHVCFCDPFGEMEGTIHRQVIEKYPHVLNAGLVILLKRLSVYSPSFGTYHLIVTLNNIVQMWTSDSIDSKSAKKSNISPKTSPKPTTAALPKASPPAVKKPVTIVPDKPVVAAILPAKKVTLPPPAPKRPRPEEDVVEMEPPAKRVRLRPPSPPKFDSDEPANDIVVSASPILFNDDDEVAEDKAWEQQQDDETAAEPIPDNDATTKQQQQTAEPSAPLYSHHDDESEDANRILNMETELEDGYGF